MGTQLLGTQLVKCNDWTVRTTSALLDLLHVLKGV